MQWNRNDNDKFSAHADTNHNLFAAVSVVCIQYVREEIITLQSHWNTGDLKKIIQKTSKDNGTSFAVPHFVAFICRQMDIGGQEDGLRKHAKTAMHGETISVGDQF